MLTAKNAPLGRFFVFVLSLFDKPRRAYWGIKRFFFLLHNQKKKKPPAKKFAGGSRIQYSIIKDSTLGLNFLGGRKTNAVAPIANVVEVDEEPVRNEEADVDAAANRSHRGCTDVDVLEQPFASCQEMADDCVDHHLSARRLLFVGEQRLLFRPRLRD